MQKIKPVLPGVDLGVLVTKICYAFAQRFDRKIAMAAGYRKEVSAAHCVLHAEDGYVKGTRIDRCDHEGAHQVERMLNMP